MWRPTAALAAVLMATTALASAPATIGPAELTAVSPAAGPINGPFPVATDSVTYDEDGGPPAGDDHLGPELPEGRAGVEYQTNGYAWERTELTYGFDNWTQDLSISQIRGAVSSALNTWASVSGLSFTEVADCGLPHNDPSCTTPDIRIRFGTGDHGAGSSDPDFDGPYGVVAHAYGPAPDAWNFTAAGDIHLDDAETWRVNGSTLDLETVILHESGHALGLSHTDQSCAAPAGPSRPIMCPVLTGTQRVISTDDRNGIQALYGDAGPPDLPDGLSVDILEPGQAGSESSANDYMIEIVNGYDNDLTGASLDVEGVTGCDRATLSVPANSITHSSCPIDPDDHLAHLETSATLTLTATLSSIGQPDSSDGPVDVKVVAADHSFSDVPAWIDPAVDWITYWGLANGYPNNTYRPDNPITRAEVTRMMWRHAGSPSVGGDHGLSDVPDWVDDAVRWATYDPSGPTEPLMTGYQDSTFRPNNPMSRAEVVRLMYRYAGAPSVSGLPHHGFPDVPNYVEDAVRWAAHDPDGSGPLEPLVSGFANGTFGPNGDITRGQETRMVFRLTDQLLA